MHVKFNSEQVWALLSNPVDSLKTRLNIKMFLTTYDQIEANAENEVINGHDCERIIVRLVIFPEQQKIRLILREYIHNRFVENNRELSKFTAF